MLDTFSFKKLDFLLIALVCALNYCGLLAIRHAAPDLYRRQLLGFIIGAALMLVVSVFDYHYILKLHWLLYAAAIALLVLVLSVGSSGGGAQRWISLFGITFQPSEAAKILLILFFAEFIIRYRQRMVLPLHLAACIALILPPVYLIYKEPDLSTSIMVILIFCVMIFTGGLEWPIVVATLAAVIPSFLWVIHEAVQGDSRILSEYQQNRILAWLHPESFADSTAYQTINSMTAIGSGGLYGRGSQEVNSLLNTGYISESQTDFIFTVIGETFGFIGCCAVILLIFLITFKCFLIAARAADGQGRIIAAGMGSWIGFQSFLNIGVATGLLPNTGIPLPFVSYGLTSLVCLYAGIGFVLNVRMQE
ncbi:MAG: rod shape-determining protein RodA [Lachnospiraceae bacterium]|nr:rod shape-determining protein RodA [Sarcina sp.]MBQ6590258.1 rod shape-determining protein RodA [Lachnospiraceae bacterium]